MSDSNPFRAGCLPASAVLAPPFACSLLQSALTEVIKPSCAAGVARGFEPARNHELASAGQNVGFPPGSNTGGNYEIAATGQTANRFPVHIDWLTFTLPTFHFDGDVRRAARYLERWTGGLFTVGGETERRYNGYRTCYLIAPVCGGAAPFLGWLGISEASDNMKGWCCFCLPGAVTSEVVDWSALVTDMWDMRGRISRVDLALDDLDGIHSLVEAESLYDAGAFNPLSGRPPQCRTTKHKGGLSGDTLYVGSRDSGKQLRCYEKGKQLGESGSSWVRYEGELLRKDKVIPWDVLLFPAQYLKGMYAKALQWMPASPIHLAAMKEKGRITLEKAMRWLKQQGGRLMIYLQEVVGLDERTIVAELSAPSGDYPLRLFNAALDSPLPFEMESFE